MLCFISPHLGDTLLFSVSLEGRVFVWKISEDPVEEDKPQITGKIVIGVQILGDEEYVHPRICWHRHKQVTQLSVLILDERFITVLLPTSIAITFCRKFWWLGLENAF